MYLTHPDQMARIRDMERDDPMFPKGVKQMLGFIYAMEGELAGKASWHAKMIELKQSMNDGYIQPFSIHKINMSGLEPILINGECAGLRDQVEHLLDGDELSAVLAKFGRDELKRTAVHVELLAIPLQEYLTSGRRKMQRSREYCTDLIWNVVCSHAMYEGKYNVTCISRRHQVKQPTTWGDCEGAKRVVNELLHRAYRKIENKFRDGCVLPC